MDVFQQTNNFKGIRIDKPDAIILSHQRSGTHFLQESLASHPQVHARGEFIMRLRRGTTGLCEGRTHDAYKTSVLVNRPGYFNVGIVMYSQFALYQQHVAQISNVKVIHLLREARNIALSLAQMEANRVSQGPLFRAHYKIGESIPAHSVMDSSNLDRKITAIQKIQSDFTVFLANNPMVMTLRYEDISINTQVNVIPETIAAAILRFLDLPIHDLCNTLQKTGSRIS